MYTDLLLSPFSLIFRHNYGLHSDTILDAKRLFSFASFQYYHSLSLKKKKKTMQYE